MSKRPHCKRLERGQKKRKHIPNKTTTAEIMRVARVKHGDYIYRDVLHFTRLYTVRVAQILSPVLVGSKTVSNV